MALERNLSRVDQFLRVGVGLILVYMGFIDTTLIGDNYLAILAGIFGIVNILAGARGYCPLYKLVGISTCSPK